MKLRWIEVKGLIYVEDFEDDHHHCRRCVLNDHELTDYCNQAPNCDTNVFIPLEPQHIPNLRKKGKTKWQS